MPQWVQLLQKRSIGIYSLLLRRIWCQFSPSIVFGCSQLSPQPPGVDAVAKLGCSSHHRSSTTACLAAPHQSLGPLSHFSDSPGCITALVCAVWIQDKSLGNSKWLLKATWSARSVLPRLSQGSEGDMFNVAWQNTARWLRWGHRGWSRGKLLPCFQNQPRLYSLTSSNSTGSDCELEGRRKSGSQNWFHSRWYFLHNNLFLSEGHRLGKYLVKGQ